MKIWLDWRVGELKSSILLTEHSTEEILPATAPDSGPRSASDLISLALAGSAVSLLVLDRASPSPTIRFASDGFERLTGYSALEVVGQNLDLLEGPETEENTSRHLARALLEARSTKVAIQHYRKNGQSFWDEVSLSSISDTDGRTSHLVCVLRDNTVEIESAAALRESFRLISRAKGEWESTVDSLLDLVLFVGSDMRVVRANRTVEAWELGSIRSTPGRNFHQVLHPTCSLSSCYILELWQRLCNANDSCDNIGCNANDEFLGRRLKITMRVPRPRNQTGRFDAAIIVVRDASETYETAETKRRKDRFEAMGYLIGGLAHEIGNPIAAMQTTLDVWDRGFVDFDDDTHQRYLERTREGVERIRATIDRILGRQGGETRMDEVVRVAPLLSRIYGLFDAQAREAGITMTIDSSSANRTCILGDISAIDEVLANLTKNAIEACKHGDQISIDASPQGDSVTIRIRDNGPGIDSSDMDHLFVPFFTTKPTGTGLGLAHVNRLMDEMGGQIEIESASGIGTVGTMRFRRAAGVSS